MVHMLVLLPVSGIHSSKSMRLLKTTVRRNMASDHVLPAYFGTGDLSLKSH